MRFVNGEYNAAPPLTMRQYEEHGDWGHASRHRAPLDTLLIRRPLFLQGLLRKTLKGVEDSPDHRSLAGLIVKCMMNIGDDS